MVCGWFFFSLVSFICGMGKRKAATRQCLLCLYQLYAWNCLAAERAGWFWAGQLQLGYKYFKYFMLRWVTGVKEWTQFSFYSMRWSWGGFSFSNEDLFSWSSVILQVCCRPRLIPFPTWLMKCPNCDQWYVEKWITGASEIAESRFLFPEWSARGNKIQ